MSRLEDHPTVRAMRSLPVLTSPTLTASELRQICLDAGADDVGFISIDRAEIDDQRADILRAFPRTRTLASLVCRMNREPIRSVARSVANAEFHHTTDHVNDVAQAIVRRLESMNIPALNPPAGFPMECGSCRTSPWPWPQGSGRWAFIAT
jgi:hypothetical protein